MSDDTLRDNRGHKCVGVVDALPAAETEREMDDRSSQLDLVAASSGLMVPFAKGASQAAQKRAAESAQPLALL